jgi:transposase
MARLGEEQVMVADGMVRKGTSIRQVSRQLGVSEGALRYRLRKRAAGATVDGRSRQASAVSGFEEAVQAILERLEDGRLSGEGRPAQARQVYEALSRDYSYTGSYRAVVRHLRQRFGVPRVRALRRVETPPGVQAQHDWFEASATLQGRRQTLYFLVGVLSHSRARFCWVSRDTSQLAWHTGHLALFRRYGGVPLWVRIDNLRTGVASGAGPTAVLNRSYRVFARECGFEVDPCRPATGSDKAKAERGVRIFRESFADLLHADWPTLEALQAALDERSVELARRLRCPVTGTTVEEAFHLERLVLQPPPRMADPFDIVVTRRVHRDCMISFEGRRYSVPFAWVGRDVEVWGVHAHVVVRGMGVEIARHPRGTKELMLMDPAHYEGDSTDRVIRPTPLGTRARLQLAGLSGASRSALLHLPSPERVRRPLDAYLQLVEAAR